MNICCLQKRLLASYIFWAVWKTLLHFVTNPSLYQYFESRFMGFRQELSVFLNCERHNPQCYNWAGILLWKLENKNRMLCNNPWMLLRMCCEVLEIVLRASFTSQHMYWYCYLTHAAWNSSFFNSLFQRRFLWLYVRTLYIKEDFCVFLPFIVNDFQWIFKAQVKKAYLFCTISVHTVPHLLFKACALTHAVMRLA